MTLARTGCVLVADVSAAQGGAVPWATLRALGCVAVVAKATEGVTYVDPCWAGNAAAVPLATMMLAGYHVFHVEDDPVRQASFFHREAFDRCELAPIVDVERTWKRETPLPPGFTGDAFLERTVACARETRSLFQKTPWIYAGPGFLAALGASAAVLAELAEFPLWLADYRTLPVVPAPWGAWTAWQWSSTTVVGGRDVDLSWFRGDEVALAQLGASFA